MDNYQKRNYLIVIALFWAGIVMGVSFIATPVKFMAPSLSLPVALDVGRYTFRVLNLLESILALSIVIISFSINRRLLFIFALLISLTVFAETFFLLPQLDIRVQTIIDGGVVLDSQLHNLYILLEIFKLVMLIKLALYELN